MSTYVAEFYNTSLIRPLQIKADYSRKFICFTFLIITFSNISFVRENTTALLMKKQFLDIRIDKTSLSEMSVTHTMNLGLEMVEAL